MPIEKPHPDAVEAREKRSVNSKTFALPDGKMQVEVRREAVCYVSDEGELRSCDTTVQQSGDKVFVEWLPYKFELHKTGIGFDFQSRESGFARVSLAAMGGEEFDSNAELRPTIDSNLITFSEVRPGVDIVFKILPLRVKTLRIVKDAKAARTFEWLCEHDADGKDKIDDTLLGEDAAGKLLDLSAEIVPIDDNSFRFVETWSGQVKFRDPKTRIKSLSAEVTYPVAIDPTVTSSITATNQDGYENIAGHVWYFASNTKIYFGMDQWDPGFTLPVNVPQGATISSATLTLNCLGVGSGGASGKLYGQAIDNASVFTTAARPTQMAKTTAFTSIATISTTGSKAILCTSTIQEIVNRAGFVQNNNVNLAIFLDAGGGYNTFEDYQHAGTSPASLSVTYTVPVPVLAVTGTADNGTYAFGNVSVGATNTHQFTLTNTGGGDDTLGTLTISGTGWSISGGDNPSGNALAASGTTTVTVSATFATAGAKTGILTIPSNDAASPYVVNLTATALTVTAAITGTATASITKADVVTGGKTIIITLTNDTWVAAGATFDAQRQAIINGIDSAQAEAAGWDAVVKALQGVSGVVRTSNTQVTITLDAQATYNITATETITVTVPSTALTGAGSAVVATPTFTVDPVANTRAQTFLLMSCND